MSWPVTRFSCTRCDYVQGNTHTWGRREYLLDDGVRVNVPRLLGWCNDCQGVALIEDLSGDEQRAALRDGKAELSVLRFWKIRQRQMLQVVMADLCDVLELLQVRHSSARCLCCGSTSVTLFSKHKETGGEMNDNQKMEFVHPGCDGTIESSFGDMRIALRPSVVFYTPKGIQIEKKYLAGYSSPSSAYFKDKDEQNARIRANRKS